VPNFYSVGDTEQLFWWARKDCNNLEELSEVLDQVLPPYSRKLGLT
jgi:hypothetical protein